MAAFNKLTLPVKQEGGRYFLDWGIETDSQEACVHGIKLRWVCDECSELYERTTDTMEGANLQPNNTGSPKLPPHDTMVERLMRSGCEKWQAVEFINWLGRQLRAGA